MSFRHHSAPLSVLAVLGLSVGMTTIGSAGFAQVQPHAGMLRYPDVSQDKIVFLYANDLWTVSRKGGQAAPLASPDGLESFPKFSPDGETIAFIGNYDGGTDIYTIAVNGGVPYRVTHHPTGERLCTWTSDDELMFFARGIQGHAMTSQMFTVSATGGLPEQLPIPYGSFGEISADGKWLAYTPHSREFSTWKRYRGGMATDIWLFNLETNESKKITDWEGTDALPMWHGRNVFYLSDNGKEERLNIWKYDTKSGKSKQVTQFKKNDVKWPSMGPGDDGQGEIVFQNGSKLYLLNLKTGKSKPVVIKIPGARPEIRTQRTDVSDMIMGGGVSATGKRAVVESRGDIWTLPAENGVARNLTGTDGQAERSPSWSPDGRWVAYFSDATGEYELYITQSDGKGETRQLTEGSKTFYLSTFWSPDSQKIAFTDKDAKVFLYDFETEESRQIDQDPRSTFVSINWSHDSRWMTYARSLEDVPNQVVWLYDVENDEHHQVSSGMFPDSSPTFDRKGDYLYFASQRRFSATYEDFGSTWIYSDSGVLIAVPLREDVEAPWALENDEEEWEDEEAEEDGDEEGDEDEGDVEDEDDEADDDEAAEDADEDEDGDDEGDEEDEEEEALPPHPLRGVWEGSVSGLSSMGLPEEFDSAAYSMTIYVDAEGNISGSSTIEIMGQSQTDDLGDITFNEETGEYTETDETDGVKSFIKGKLEGNTLSGTWEIPDMGASGTFTLTKTDEEVEEADSDEVAEVVEIDLDGFESRGIMLPVGEGNFYNLAVNDKNQLLYMKSGEGIKLFDMEDDTKSEKSVSGAAYGFDISADGKKLLLMDMTGTLKIGKAAASSAGKAVPTKGMVTYIEPRVEWKQVFTDAWRIQRDWFYAGNMHGVDWDAVYKQYVKMIDDCNTREDVSYVIGEMIGELNVGHSYYFGGGTDHASSIPVGMLGVDYELADGAYRIARIHHGAAWDADARGLIMGSELDINEGDYLLAVNGIPLDTSLDPWAAFIGLANQQTILTVSEKPEIDDDAREVSLKLSSNERAARYRGWIEHNRKYVEEQTDGQVGYIFVPDTGMRGQSDLFRQFVGQYGKKALIIDERWNGGGQLPNRFIELLNRPVTNYFAIRDGKSWQVPGFAHNGPKCMLINGLAGSGGDMFPWLFRHAELGKLIGTRTWGGLVGMSGNPGLIDGGYMTVPRFAFFETDGTWGVEGHGVDPDIEVIDDPALMVDGGDPQLDVAIKQMLKEIAEHPYVAPKRPDWPDRSHIGITEDDK